MAGLKAPGIPKYLSPQQNASTPSDGATPEAELAAGIFVGSETAFHALMQTLGGHTRSRLEQSYTAVDAIYRTVAHGR
jgi:hypothetical protein